MKTSLRAEPSFSRRVCYDAAMICCALAFSYLEAVLPISLLIPLPGVKLGLANLAVMLAFFSISSVDAAIISFVRILLSALLFGSPISFFFSLLGGAVAYLSMFLSRIAIKKGVMSFIGGSVFSSACHAAGQIAAACLIYGAPSFWYLPIILFAGVPFGAVIGLLLNLLYPKTEKIINAKKN